MYKVKCTTKFKKDYKLVAKRGYDTSLPFDSMDVLRKGQTLPPNLKDHGLQGEFKGFRECHTKAVWLLICLIE